MALGRLNRPGLMGAFSPSPFTRPETPPTDGADNPTVYGGTMQPGSCGAGMPSLDVVSAFQSYGKYLEMGATEEAEKVRLDTVRNSCRKEGGACGGEWSCAVLSGAGKRRGN
jgi:dihydroxy-acid dehydratase